MSEDNKKENQSIEIKTTYSKCIANAEGIKYFTQVFFSMVMIVFAIYMIVTSERPSNETLWISLLTSTMATFTNPPSLSKK